MSTPNPLTMESLGQLLSGGMQAPGVDMTQGGASQGLNNFFNTPGFQLQYGSAPANQMSLFGQYNPNLAFESDPGVQMAAQQGMKPLLHQMASHGMGQSGALAKSMSDYMYNHYNQYTQGQQSLFGNYQGQLAGLTNLGASQSGAATANSNAQNQSNLIAQGNLAIGQGISAANLGVGDNISSLLANQGVLNASGYLNTGAAQANNLFQGLQMAAQLAANQRASQNGQQSSLFGGMGQLQGAQQGVAGQGPSGSSLYVGNPGSYFPNQGGRF